MGSSEFLDRLHFDHNQILDDQVEFVLPHEVSVVGDHNLFLDLRMQPTATALNYHRVLIDAFNESRAQLLVNADHATDDPLRKFILKMI